MKECHILFFWTFKFAHAYSILALSLPFHFVEYKYIIPFDKYMNVCRFYKGVIESFDSRKKKHKVTWLFIKSFLHPPLLFFMVYCMDSDYFFPFG